MYLTGLFFVAPHLELHSSQAHHYSEIRNVILSAKCRRHVWVDFHPLFFLSGHRHIHHQVSRNGSWESWCMTLLHPEIKAWFGSFAQGCRRTCLHGKLRWHPLGPRKLLLLRASHVTTCHRSNNSESKLIIFHNYVLQWRELTQNLKSCFPKNVNNSKSISYQFCTLRNWPHPAVWIVSFVRKETTHEL